MNITTTVFLATLEPVRIVRAFVAASSPFCTLLNVGPLTAFRASSKPCHPIAALLTPFRGAVLPLLTEAKSCAFCTIDCSELASYGKTSSVCVRLACTSLTLNGAYPL